MLSFLSVSILELFKERLPRTVINENEDILINELKLNKFVMMKKMRLTGRLDEVQSSMAAGSLRSERKKKIRTLFKNLNPPLFTRRRHF